MRETSRSLSILALWKTTNHFVQLRSQSRRFGLTRDLWFTRTKELTPERRSIEDQRNLGTETYICHITNSTMKKRYPFITAAEAIVFSLVLSFLFVVLLLTLFVEIAK